MQVDQTVVGWVDWSDPGLRGEIGLESYDQIAFVPLHHYEELMVTHNEGFFEYFSGRDDSSAAPTGMCGGWNSDIIWRAAQNNSC